jgi:hypothetical protein
VAQRPQRAQRRCSAPGGRRARQQQRFRRNQQPKGHSGERLDKSIAWIHRETTRHTCASRMTARHSPLFTLRSGQSGLGIYTSQRDAALTSAHVENSGPLLGSKRPVCIHFTCKNCADPLRCNRSALIREALHADLSAPMLEANYYYDLYICL